MGLKNQSQLKNPYMTLLQLHMKFRELSSQELRTYQLHIGQAYGVLGLMNKRQLKNP